eukprot:15689-Heterococcus_DN1.PRE.2
MQFAGLALVSTHRFTANRSVSQAPYRCRMHHPDWHTLRKLSCLPLSAKRIQQNEIATADTLPAYILLNYFVIAAKQRQVTSTLGNPLMCTEL